MNVLAPVLMPVLRPLVRPITGYAQGGGFSPASLFSAGEQGAWYDPSDFSTMWQDAARTTPVTAVGQPVGALNDKSGRGSHATQATAGKRPVLQQDGTGKYYLQSDGVDDWMLGPVIGLDSPEITFISGQSLNNTVGTQIIIANNRYRLGFTDTGARFTTAGVLDYTDAAYNAVSGVKNVLGVVYDSGFDATFYKNGAVSSVVAGASDGAFGEFPMKLCSDDGSSSFFAGSMYQMILIKRNLTTDERNNAFSFVNSKIGAY